jgi:hypothetical protein
MVFICMQTRSPVNSDLPKFVEMIRVKSLSLNFGDYLSLNETEVDGRICNLMSVNIGLRPQFPIELHDLEAGKGRQFTGPRVRGRRFVPSPL